MPLSYKIEDGIVYITTIGRIGFQEQMNFIWGWISDPDRPNPIRVLRDAVVIYEGELESLRRFKDDANEVRNGMECGIGVKNYNDVKVGDQIEVFEVKEISRSL